MESPTHDRSAVNRLGDYLMEQFTEQGILLESHVQKDVGNHLSACWNGSAAQTEDKPALLLGHFDTVWPIGQIKDMPVCRDEDRLYGPGIFDMKAGVMLMLYTAKAVHEGIIQLRRPLKILLMADEESSGLHSRRMIEEYARNCSYVLCLEPPLPGGRVKTARKGSYKFRLEVFGQAAHAGVDHDKGVNAVEELAHQVLRLQAMTDYARGTTVNVGTVHTRNAPNVVPDYAVAEVDVRAVTRQEAEEVSQRILALSPVHPKTKLVIGGGAGRPPLERTAAGVALFQQAAGLAQELGFELGEGSTGGSSDGSYTAALGIPTLDGLGVDGHGGHARDEHILISALPRKAALLMRFLEEG